MRTLQHVIGITESTIPLQSFLMHSLGGADKVQIIHLKSVLQRLTSAIFVVDFQNSEVDDDMDEIWLRSPNILLDKMKHLLQHDPKWLPNYLAKTYGNQLFLVTGLCSNDDIDFVLECGARVLCADNTFQDRVDDNTVVNIRNVSDLNNFINKYYVSR